MSDEHWQTDVAKSLTVFLNGAKMPCPGPRGERLTDDCFLVLFNAHGESLSFTLPGPEWGSAWIEVLNTAEPSRGRTGQESVVGVSQPSTSLQLAGRSIIVLREARPGAS